MFVARSYNHGPKEDAQDRDNLQAQAIDEIESIDYEEFWCGSDAGDTYREGFRFRFLQERKTKERKKRHLSPGSWAKSAYA